MSATNIRFKARAINADPTTIPENGWVEGFYYQDLDHGVVKHYIYNCPMTWEVDPSTIKWIGRLNLDEYKDDIDKVFWAYIIKEKFVDEARKAPGGTIKTITKEVLSGFDLKLPCYAEQVKIGAYFKQLDNLLTLHQHKCTFC